MGYKATDVCLKKAYDDERLFVLMTRDETAPEVIRFWAMLNASKQPQSKIKEALDCADEMERRRDEFRLRIAKNLKPGLVERLKRLFNAKKKKTIDK
jgi:hypothetical protein